MDVDTERAQPMVAQTGLPKSGSPPATWDLLHTTTGEVARMRMIEEVYGLNHGRGPMAPLGKPSLLTVPMKDNSIMDAGFFLTTHFPTSSCKCDFNSSGSNR